MPRKTSKPAAQLPGRRPTAVVRVEADLARMLSIISTATGEDISDILSPQIRPFVERRYAEVVQKLGQEIKGGR
jgi:hypothetical protein